ncbi:MAG TPA: hypothetical protein G4O18_09670 [Dehalococcoidia bacterium]|nr:hypothetical protein [Dehalococcoidia bacterium]
MADCPNCGQATERTQDWACPWCGYPLVSGSFREMSKTYQEAKVERLQRPVVVEVVDETKQVVEAELEPEPVLETETKTEVESASEEGPVVEVGEEESPGIVPVTIEELNEACKADKKAAEERFAGSILQITAEIGRIPPMESTEKPCLILVSSGKSRARNVLCAFGKQHEAAISSLSVGQLVTVQGKYDGCVINILINDCVLVD